MVNITAWAAGEQRGSYGGGSARPGAGPGRRGVALPPEPGAWWLVAGAPGPAGWTGPGRGPALRTRSSWAAAEKGTWPGPGKSVNVFES